MSLYFRIEAGVIIGLLLLLSCSNSINGPVEMVVLQPTAGAHCQYTASPATFETLTSLAGPSGSLGSVVHNPANVISSTEILRDGVGFSPVTTEYYDKGGKYVPVDFQTMYASSLYYAVELGNQIFKRLDPSVDMRLVDANMAETKIVYEAKRSFKKDSKEVVDNAEYIGKPVERGGTVVTLNYLLSYPTDKVTNIPLGFNTGIMVHEFTHLVFHQLFHFPSYELVNGLSDSSSAYLGSIDEGTADYFGYLATQDPGFFLCSYPSEERDMANRQYTIAQMDRAIKADAANFDIHAGGAIWAAIHYDMGKSLGFDRVGRNLIRLMKGMAGCFGSGSTNIDFSTLEQCESSLADPADRTAISAAFSAARGQ